MNNQCFRVIFSKTLQRLVVVSELAKAEGKSKASSSSSPSTSGSFLQKICVFRPLVFGLLTALGFVNLVGHAAAETLIIQADPSAPKHEQPIILNTSAGVPQINIQTPNAKGLSHNKFSQFDVAEQGAVLNNSRTSTQSHQGGWVQGNPYLARGEAKVILNEVNASSPSTLRGYIEVAGQKADVVIANPSGIHCDGCGVINAGRATFSSGRVEVKNGQLEQFVVEKGKIKISGKGMDNRDVDYTEILARETEANAGIWSKKETVVVAGKNTITRRDKQKESDNGLEIIPNATTASHEETPQFAIDVGELGGMYAGKIHLIGTEQGVGVRNAGEIGTSSETVQIDSRGQIINQGVIQGKGDIVQNSAEGIENQGVAVSERGHVTLNSAGLVAQKGQLGSKNGEIHLRSEESVVQTGKLAAQRIVVNAARAKIGGESVAESSLTVTAEETLQLSGTHAAPHQSFSGKGVQLERAKLYADHLAVKGAEGMQITSSHLNAAETLRLKAPSLILEKSVLDAKETEVDSPYLRLSHVKWQQHSDKDLDLQLSGTFNNYHSEFRTGGNINLSAGRIDNQGGKIIAGKTLSLNSTGGIDNRQGLLAGDDVYIDVGSQHFLNDNTTRSGGVTARGNLSLKAGLISSQAGRIISQKQQYLGGGTLIQKGGYLSSGEAAQWHFSGAVEMEEARVTAAKLNLTANSLNLGRESEIQAGNLHLQVQGGVHQQNSRLSAALGLTASLGHFISQESELSAEQIEMTVSGQMRHHDSHLIGKQRVKLVAQGVDNQRSQISSQTDTLSIDTQHAALLNQHGKLMAARALDIKSGHLNNDRGLIYSESLVALQADEVRNQQTQAAEKNQGIISQGALSLQAESLKNQQGYLYSQAAQQLMVRQQVVNRDGVLGSGGSQYIEAGQLLNQAGVIASEAQTTVKVNRDLNNDRGFIGSDELVLDSEQLTQVQGHLNGRTSLSVRAERLQSREGSEIRGGDVQLHIHGLLAQQDSQLTAGQALRVKAAEIENQQGLIAGLGGVLDIDTADGKLKNQGVIQSAETLHIKSGELDNQQGRVMANGALTVETNPLKNHSGVLYSVGPMQIEAEQIDNQHGEVSTQGSLVLNVENDILNRFGVLGAKTALSARSRTLDNQSGDIAAVSGLIHLTQQAELINRQGKITAREALTLSTNRLDNRQGYLHSLANLDLQAQTIHNREGQIAANAALSAEASQFDNRGGEVSSLNQGIHLAVTTLDNRKEGERGSRIQAAGHLLVSGERLDNSGTKRTSNESRQGLMGETVTLQVDHINNESGGIYAKKALQLQGTHHLNNRHGELYTEDKVETDETTSLDLNNEGGQIQAFRGVNLRKVKIASEALGKIQSQDAVNIHLDGDATLNGPLIEAKELNMTVGGRLHNQGVFYHYDRLNLTAESLVNDGNITALEANVQVNGEIRNQASGRIHGNLLNVQSQAFVNHGELMAKGLYLKAAEQFNNLGKGLVAGRHLAIQAQRLNNLTIDDVAFTPSLWAKERMDLGVGTLVNRDGASIISEGDMAIGVKLNRENEAEGDALEIHNGTAVIDVKGNAIVNTGKLLNDDLYLSIHSTHSENRLNITVFENATTKIVRDITRTRESIVKENEAPAKFLVGGDLALNGQDLHNRYSHLLIGGRLLLNETTFTTNPEPTDLNGGGVTLINEDLFNPIEERDVGIEITYEKVCSGGNCRWVEQARQDVSEVRHLREPFKVVRNDIGEVPDSGGSQVTERELDELIAEGLSFDTVAFGESSTPGVSHTIGVLLGRGHQAVTAQESDVMRLGRNPALSMGMWQRPVIQRVYLPNERLAGQSGRDTRPRWQYRPSYLVENLSGEGPLLALRPELSGKQVTETKAYLKDPHEKGHQAGQNRLLGDSYVQHQLIQKQVAKLTGKRFLNGYHRDDEQYQALLNHGKEHAKALDLREGVALSAEQIAGLKADIVWFVDKPMQINGQTEIVRVPKVYTAPSRVKVLPQGALISANHIQGRVSGVIRNSGTIQANESLRLKGGVIDNLGKMAAKDIALSAQTHLNNVGGKLQAKARLSLQSEGTMTLNSSVGNWVEEANQIKRRWGLSRITKKSEQSVTQVDQLSELSVSDEGGVIEISAKGDIAAKGTQFNSRGRIVMESNGQVDLGVLTQEHWRKKDEKNFSKQSDFVASRLEAAGSIYVRGDKGINGQSLFIGSEKGDITLESRSGEIYLGAAKSTQEQASYERHSKIKWDGGRKVTEKSSYDYDEQSEGSALYGENIRLIGRKLVGEGLRLSAEKDMLLQGKEGVLLKTVSDKHQHERSESSYRSGPTFSMKKGTIRLGIEKVKQSGEQADGEYTLNRGGLLAKGALSILASEGEVNVKGVGAKSGGDMVLMGKSVVLDAQEIHKTHDSASRASRSGVSLGITYDPLQAGRQTYKDYKAANHQQSSNLGKWIARDIAWAEGITRAMTPIVGTAGKHQRSQSQSRIETEATVVSLQAGGNLKLLATEGNITTHGAVLHTDKNYLAYAAKGNITYGVATIGSRSSGQQKSSGVGVTNERVIDGGLTAYRNHQLAEGETRLELGTTITAGGQSLSYAERGNIHTIGTEMGVKGDNLFKAGGHITFDAAKHQQRQAEKGSGRGMGSAQIDETTYFSGYYSNKSRQTFTQELHKGSLIGSEQGNLIVQAGGDVMLASSQLLANEGKVAISGKSITSITYDDLLRKESKESDLKIGSFAKVSSPLLSLVQSVESTANTLNNSQASDRLKALHAASTIAQGYSAVADLAQGVLARAEVGVGFRYGESKERYYELTSQGNLINGKQGVSLNAREGSIVLNKTDLSTKDSHGQLNKAGEVSLSAKGHIELNSGRHEMESESKRTNYGAQVGVGVQVGANSGWYFYAEGGAGQDKSKSHIHHKDNSHIHAGKLVLNAGGDVTLKGASAYAEQIQGQIGGKLHIESEQSHEHHSQSSSSGQARIQGGMVWGGSVAGHHAEGNSHQNQVEEQAGLFAGSGGYQLVAKETHLKGGAIASTNPALSVLATNNLTYEDIRNDSSAKALSLSGGFSYSGGGKKENHPNNQGSQTQANQTNPTQPNPSANSLTSGQYWQKVGNDIGKPLQGEGGQGGMPNLGLPQYEKHTDNSITRATLTAGTLILNKDSKPVITTPEAIGINTHLDLANEKVDKLKDIGKMLTEQTATAQAMSEMANAASVYAKRKYQETGDERWKDGGSHKRKLDATLAALGTALGGGNLGQVATAALSPELNAQIHEITKDNKAANLLTHAALSALEAKATGNSATAGAVAGLVGEGSAMLLAETLLKKPTALLTAEERSLLKAAGLVSGAAAGGAVGGNTASTTFGAETAKRAVENNALLLKDIYAYERDLKKAIANGESTEAVHEAFKALSKKQREALLADCEIDCRIPVIRELGAAINRADEVTGGVEGIVKDWLKTLPAAEQTKFHQIVERENQKTIAVLEEKKGGFEKAAGMVADGASMLARENGLGNANTQNNFAKRAQPKIPKPTNKVISEDNILFEGGISTSYKSHIKHINGKDPDAGLEPKGVLDLFKSSIPTTEKKQNKFVRYSVDEKGNIHRFFGDNNSKEFHWSGSTGDVKNPLMENEIPNDIKKQLRGK